MVPTYTQGNYDDDYQTTTDDVNGVTKVKTTKIHSGITKVKDWDYKRPGIRAQLIDTESGKFQMDFVVENEGKFTHILNAVSPGWTASIPFAKYIVDNKIGPGSIIKLIKTYI
jgi:hypothetical protein